MFCGECGAPNPDTNQFCRNCGKPLGRRPPAGQPAVPPVPVSAYPASQPVTQASAVPGQVPPAAAAPAPAPVPATAPKRTWNLLGILSLIPGILSWGILTIILALLAILLGVISLVLFRKATGRIGISSITGIILGITAIIVTIVLV